MLAGVWASSPMPYRLGCCFAARPATLPLITSAPMFLSPAARRIHQSCGSAMPRTSEEYATQWRPMGPDATLGRGAGPVASAHPRMLGRSGWNATYRHHDSLTGFLGQVGPSVNHSQQVRVEKIVLCNECAGFCAALIENHCISRVFEGCSRPVLSVFFPYPSR